MAARYRAAPADTLCVAPLDTFTAVYHRASGITHLLASPALELIELLQEAPADGIEILARLRERYDVTDAEDAAVAARLAELVEAGLVATA